MNKKIYINGRFLSQEITGVQKFAWGVSDSLNKLGYEVIFLSPKGIIHNPEFGIIHSFGKLYGHAWEQIELPIYVKNNKLPHLLNLCNTAPLIGNSQYITVHDLAFYRHPEWFNSKFSKWYNWLIPKISTRAKHIFTVSQFSKKELIKAYKLPQKKITVVPNGIYWPADNENSLKIDDFGKYALLVGSDNPRKNYSLLFRAFSALKTKDFKLVIVGKPSPIFKSTSKKESEDIVWLSNVSTGQLKELFCNAHLYINPSLYEGFGLPIIESISAKCPVLASNIEPFREIFEGWIHFFENNNENDFSKKLADLMNNEKEVIDPTPLLEKLNYKTSAQKIADTILFT